MSSRYEAVKVARKATARAYRVDVEELTLDAAHEAGLIVWADELEQFGFYCEADPHMGEVVSECEHPVGTTERSYKFPIYRKREAS